MRTKENARTRNNPAVKAVAVAVRATLGLTVSDALRMMVFALPSKRQGLPSPWFPVTRLPVEPVLLGLRTARGG